MTRRRFENQAARVGRGLLLELLLALRLREDVLLRVELVAEQRVVAVRALVLEGVRPEVPADLVPKPKM